MIFALILICQPTKVSAHNPTSVTLEYDSGTEILTVVVNHGVPAGSLPSHYIYNVVVEKNSVQVVSRDYVSENNTVSGLTDTFSVSAVDGDVLKATARCTQAGIKSGEITLTTTTTTTDTGTTTPPPGAPTTLYIAIAVVAIGIVGVIVAILRRR